MLDTIAPEEKLGIVHKGKLHMSHFSYACKTEGENGISRLISKTA